MEHLTLISYLVNNISKGYGDFTNSAPYKDEYDRFRRDAAIYCYSGMLAVVKQITTSPEYSHWMKQNAATLRQSLDEDRNLEFIVRRTYDSVTEDGDDICDEQSVGWYMAVHTYMHCLAFDSYDFKEIFESSWKRYYSVEYQNFVRGYSKRMPDIDFNEFVDKCLDADRKRILDYRSQIRMKFPYGSTDDEYLSSLCMHAKDIYETSDLSEETLGAIVMAVSSLYMEETSRVLTEEGLIIVAKKILSAS